MPAGLRYSFYQARQYADLHPAKAALTVFASWLIVSLCIATIGAAGAAATTILLLVVLPYFANLQAIVHAPDYVLAASLTGAMFFFIFAQVLILTDLRHFIAQAIGRKAFG